MADASEIGLVLKRFSDSSRNARYRLHEEYYLGDHRLAFATDRFRRVFGGLFASLADNLCASVVDVQSDRLEVTGFVSSKATTRLEEAGMGQVPTVSDSLGEKCWDFWERNDMDIVSDEVHREMLKHGNAYVIVDRNSEGKSVIWPQNTPEIEVVYSRENLGEILYAAKLWKEGDERWRLNMYYPDRIEKYITKGTYREAPEFKREIFTGFGENTPNEFGKVPVFHFSHKKMAGNGYSELKDVIPVQDALNKSIADLLIGMEFQSFRQRYVIGWEPEPSEDGTPVSEGGMTGAERFMTFGSDQVKVGEFGQADLGPLLEAQNHFRAEIARVTGIPIHYLYVTGSSIAPSGEALKVSELRFTRKLVKMQSRLGKVWENVLGFALLVEDAIEPDTEVDLNCLWLPASSRTDNELMDSLLKKKELGVPESRLQKEMGYDDGEIKQFAEEKASRAPAIPTPGGEEDDDSPEAVARRARLDTVVPPQFQSNDD